MGDDLEVCPSRPALCGPGRLEGSVCEVAAGLRYPWRRWWLPAASEPMLVSGFLHDPDGPFGRFADDVPVRLEDCDGISCVILFGDAGMGKSAELEDDLRRQRQAGRSCVLLDLGSSETWNEARQRLLSSQEVIAWRAGPDEQLTLLVDSVDEVSTSMRKLTGQLLALLDEDLPIERLLLRVAGRSAAFPSLLRDGLSSRFGDLQELSLAPLTLADVERAAEAGLPGGDVAGFITALTERDIGVLASRPITLDMLMQLYGEGPLPAGRRELYERATAKLVRETSERRLDETATDIPAAERIETAQVLAAVSLLCGRSSIAVHRYPQMPEGLLSLDQVTGRGDSPEVFTEVTKSALFSAAAGNVVRWTHRDFPEFLAAQRLARMGAGDAIALLSDPNDQGKIVPQLAGTAVWAALLSEDLFGRLVSSEPELLLTSSLADAEPGKRQLLLQALLAQMEHSPPGDWHRYYRWLDYPGLPGDVAPCLDPGMPEWLHREAAWILSETGHHELDARLVVIVEDTAMRRHPADYDEEVALAISVAGCLRDSGPAIQEQLRVIAADASAPWALRAAIYADMWGNRPASEILAMLSAANISDHRGFAASIGSAMADVIRQHDADAGAVADWLAANGVPAAAAADIAADPDDQSPAGEWIWVIEACTLAAARKPGDLSDGQWKSLAAVFSALSPHMHHPFHWSPDDIGSLPAGGRHRAVSEILLAEPGPVMAHLLVRASLIRPEDLGWVLRQHADAPAGTELAAAYRLAARLICEPTPENRDLAVSIASEKGYAGLVDELFSPQRVAEHAEAQAAAKRQKADQDRKKQADFSREQLTAAVDARDWRTAAAELRKQHQSRKWAPGTSLDTAPGWRSLTPALRAAILDMAADYLAGVGSPAPGPGLGDDVGDACTLLASADHRRLDALDAAVLAGWLPVLLDTTRQHRASTVLIEYLRSRLPDQVDRAVTEGVEKDLKRGHAFGIDRIGTYTSPSVIEALDRIARDPAATAYIVHGALLALLERDEPRGYAAVLDMLQRRPGCKPQPDTIYDPAAEGRAHWDRAAAAAAALARSPALGTRLDELLREMSASEEFASDVIAWTDHAGLDRRAWETLSADQKAGLLIWARRNLPQEPFLPPGQDVDILPVHDFPRRILTLLTSDVSELSVSALHRAADDLDEPWLRKEAGKLAAAIREAGWSPLAPDEAREILEHPHRRVITSEAQLAHVLLDGLDAVTRDIRENTNHRAAYWHRQLHPKGTVIPCDEPEFMAQLSWHLSTVISGVSLRSEVELNHGLADVRGSQADIQATVHDGGREISVVIEGKGIWHKDVRTAITTQLHDRYLTGAPSSTGIYVVAAYRGERWLDKDSRRAKADQQDIPELRAFLTETARQLTMPPRAIHARVLDMPLNPGALASN